MVPPHFRGVLWKNLQEGTDNPPSTQFNRQALTDSIVSLILLAAGL